MRIDVVIPACFRDPLLDCIRSIHAHDPQFPRGQIVVVDDGLDPGTLTFLSQAGHRVVQGQKPFIFARNVNLGMKTCPGHVLILNQDTKLDTMGGITQLGIHLEANHHVGVASAAIRGAVGNKRQHAGFGGLVEEEGRVLSFIAAAVNRKLIEKIGLLDERFVGYGYDDNDYCKRARDAGFKLQVVRSVTFIHEGMSAFRTRGNFDEIFAQNKKLYIEKWGNENA